MVVVHFDIEPTEKSESVRLAQEHRAESLSISGLFAPQVLAVIGAGRTPRQRQPRDITSPPRRRLTGQLHAVNPTAEEILGVETHPGPPLSLLRSP